MSLNLIILFRLNSGDECSLYLALLMQRMAFVCKISSINILFASDDRTPKQCTIIPYGMKHKRDGKIE